MDDYSFSVYLYKMNKPLNAVYPPKNILITGASSGVGAALALHYAAPETCLFLSGRNPERLAEIAEMCRARGAACTTSLVDVGDKAAMASWISGILADAPLDLVIANAGISGGTANSAPEDLCAADAEIFNTNVTGVLNTLHPALPDMVRRGGGQLVIISSVAGFVPLPGAPAYAASKAAVRFYGEALAVRLAPSGVGVSVVCPGFIVSRMTDANHFPMPFLMPTDRAAALIARGIEARQIRIDFPLPMAMGLSFLGILPHRLRLWLMRRLPEKQHYKK